MVKLRCAQYFFTSMQYSIQSCLLFAPMDCKSYTEPTEQIGALNARDHSPLNGGDAAQLCQSSNVRERLLLRNSNVHSLGAQRIASTADKGKVCVLSLAGVCLRPLEKDLILHGARTGNTPKIARQGCEIS